jgi:hypothetical protein
MPAGYSGTPLSKKLGLKEGSRVFAADAPANYLKLLAPLPARVHMASRIDGHTDILHFFTVQRSVLARSLRTALARMRPDAAIWVSWPKRAAKVRTDITEDVIREVALPLGLVDIKVCAVDETWSGLKLVLRKELRG